LGVEYCYVVSFLLSASVRCLMVTAWMEANVCAVSCSSSLESAALVCGSRRRVGLGVLVMRRRLIDLTSQTERRESIWERER
jgi:hypothetical protein